jgi:anthranilate phosphoribosyltransferase
MATKMLGTLRALGAERAVVFHGDDGLDELTTTTTSTVHELVDGGISTFTVDPMDLGISRAEPPALAGGDAATNAAAVEAVLAGDKGAHRDIALLNAAAALVVAGTAPDLAAGVEIATDAIASGRARAALDRLVATSTRLAREREA